MWKSKFVEAPASNNAKLTSSVVSAVSPAPIVDCENQDAFHVIPDLPDLNTIVSSSGINTALNVSTKFTVKSTTKSTRPTDSNKSTKNTRNTHPKTTSTKKVCDPGVKISDISFHCNIGNDQNVVDDLNSLWQFANVEPAKKNKLKEAFRIFKIALRNVKQQRSPDSGKILNVRDMIIETDSNNDEEDFWTPIDSKAEDWTTKKLLKYFETCEEFPTLICILDKQKNVYGCNPSYLCRFQASDAFVDIWVLAVNLQHHESYREELERFENDYSRPFDSR